MLTIYTKNFLPKTNTSIMEYWKQSTQESIRRRIEKNKNINNSKFYNNNDENNNGNDDNLPVNFYGFLAFLSISSIVIYFYKRLRN